MLNQLSRRKFPGFWQRAVLLLLLFLLLPYSIPLSASGKAVEDLVIDGGRFVTVDNIKTYVVERGPINGKPILFIHGLFGSTFSARYQIEPLAAAGWRVIAYDRPGFGLTEKPYRFDYSEQNQAKFAADLLDTLGISKAIIWAHSGGGAIQMRFALNYPQRVERLIIVDGAVLGEPGLLSQVGSLLSFSPIYRWTQVGAHLFFDQEKMATFLRGFYANPNQVTIETIAGYWRICQTPHWERGVLGQIRDAGTQPFDATRLSDINAETLLIWGEADRVTPLEQGKKLHSHLTHSTLYIIPDAGHLPMEEFPVEFNHLILTFLEGNRP